MKPKQSTRCAFALTSTLLASAAAAQSVTPLQLEVTNRQIVDLSYDSANNLVYAIESDTNLLTAYDAALNELASFPIAMPTGSDIQAISVLPDTGIVFYVVDDGAGAFELWAGTNVVSQAQFVATLDSSMLGVRGMDCDRFANLYINDPGSQQVFKTTYWGGLQGAPCPTSELAFGVMERSNNILELPAFLPSTGTSELVRQFNVDTCTYTTAAPQYYQGMFVSALDGGAVQPNGNRTAYVYDSVSTAIVHVAIEDYPAGYRFLVDDFSNRILGAEGDYLDMTARTAAVGAMTRSIDPAGVTALSQALRQDLVGQGPGADPSHVLVLGVYANAPGTAVSEQGGSLPISNLMRWESARQVGDNCPAIPEACGLALQIEEELPEVQHGVFTATLGTREIVGFYGEDYEAGVFTTVLIPLYEIPATSPLTPPQYGEFMLAYRDELFPTSLDFLFDTNTAMAGSGAAAPPGGEGLACIGPDVLECIQLAVNAWLAEMDQLRSDYNFEYNQILERAQLAAERCSPLHSFGGFCKFIGKTVITIGIWPILDACQVWEDFDLNVRQLNERHHRKMCQAHKRLRDAVMACLEDCPREIRDAIQAELDIAMMQMGC